MKYFFLLIIAFATINMSNCKNTRDSEITDSSTESTYSNETTKRSKRPRIVKPNDKLKMRVVQGYDCTVAEYSYLVSIIKGAKPFCGGTLINSLWVLTAAHCCDRMKDVHRYTVVVGMEVWNKQYTQRVPIQRMYKHINFTLDPLNSDICLVKVEEEIRTNNKVQISKLITTEQFDGIQNSKCSNAIAVGFGHQTAKNMRKKRMKEAYDPHVKCAVLKVLEKKECTDFMGQLITDSIFCARDAEQKGRDSCQGDSGGPLICDGVQVGVISGGFGCGVPIFPGLYCRVDIFQEFIGETVSGNLRFAIAADGSIRDINVMNYLLIFFVYILSI